MRKRTFLGLAVAAVLGAAGTTGAAHAEMAAEITKPVTITFYNYNLATASAGADATREMIAKFEQENPLIKVKTVGVPSNDIITRLQADMAAGMQPDVAQLVFRDLIYLASDLGAQPLEDMAGAKGYAALTDGLIPRGVDLGKINGKTYGLAYTFSTPILYYNADLFRKAGLDPETPPKTWAEVKTVMATPSTLDPVIKEMLYIAVSVTNGCSYCVHSHTAAAKAKGMTDAQYAELLSIISLAGKTNQLALGLQVPVDSAFDADAAKP